MAISVPSTTEVQSKWVTRSSGATADYTKGVQGAGPAWQAAVDQAEPSWASGVATAQANRLYSKGVTNKSNTYVTNAVNLGGTRYGTGIQNGAGKYGGSMGKVLGVIANITLPARGPVGTNMQRSSLVADTLHQAKLNGQFS